MWIVYNEDKEKTIGEFKLADEFIEFVRLLVIENEEDEEDFSITGLDEAECYINEHCDDLILNPHEPRYICNSCHGHFTNDKMVFDVNDSDFCLQCCPE